jgi:hypothetical protein
MILYVNGDSHAAAAEAVNPHAWAQDDGMFWGLGKQPHPDNERASFGCELANWLRAILYLDAQAGGSNRRIIRTTRQWLLSQEDVKDLFVVLQWSTWEREEWFDGNDGWVQVNASGIDDVPDHFKHRYKEYIADIDWKKCTNQAHETIWQFHQELKAQGIRHVMFNGNNHFGDVQNRYDWENCYIDPYDPAQTYNSILREKGFKTVNPNSWHFGPDAHCYWAEYVLQYIKRNQLLSPNEIPTY